MIKIVINGTVADLKGASKQELVFQNPMWDYEGMLGEYGLPFSLPFSPTNDRIFSNARSEFSEAMPLSYLCEQYLNDDLIAEGLIILKDTNGAYNCNFTSNLRDIFTPVSGSVMYDGYLRDILPAGPSVSPVANRNALTTWNNIVAYPIIFNDQFYAANAPVGWDNYVNSHSGITYQNTTFVPVVSVKYIFTQIASYYGIIIGGDFITDTRYDNLIIFHNISEDGATTAQLKLAVGDLTVAGFVNEIRNTLALTGDIDLLNKKITLDFAKKYYDAEVTENLSNICSAILSKNSAPYKGIELDFVADTEDKSFVISTLFTKYSTTISSSAKNRLIKTNLCPLSFDATGNIATMQINGRTATNGQATKPVRPRIAFYLGLNTISLGIRPHMAIRNLFTGATISLRNYISAVSIVDRQTQLEPEEAFWQNTFEASFQINLRKLSLSSFDIKSKVHIHGWNYLIKRIVMDCNNPENSLLEAYRA